MEMERALRILETHRKASHAYYVKHTDSIKRKNGSYWEAHKDAINARRRLSYQAWRENKHTPL